MKRPIKQLIHYAHRMAEADMVFWLMPALMVLLIAGTVAQKWIGLFRAHEMFFSSFVFWAGLFPLPGGLTLLGLLTLNLTAKFLLKSEWTWRKSGIHLAHLGALILLFGGLITALNAREYYMLIPEGSATQYIYSYNDRALSIYEGEAEKHRLPFGKIDSWKTALPFTITPALSCDNCKIIKREDAPDYETRKPYQAMAQFMALQKIPQETEPEANLSGLEFSISGTGEQNGTYIAFDGMPKPITITLNDKIYTLIFGKEQTALPFTIGLHDFVKDDYAGTQTARGYHSDIIVKDSDLEWPVRVEMNKPLRYKGYTFFQSSFQQTHDVEMTIFSVVQNKGWLFPYIGALVIGVGLILHCLLALTKRATP